MGKKIRIGCVITVPLDPTTSKVVLTEICGRPALTHLLDRVKSCWYLDDVNIVLSCPADSTSDALQKAAKDAGISIYPNNHAHSIEAISDSAETFDLDLILHVDATHPLTDPIYMDLAIERVLTDGNIDMAQTANLPIGTGACCLSLTGVKLLADETKRSDRDTGSDALDPGPCKCAHIHPMSAAHIHEGLNLTLNDANGINSIRTVLERFYKDSHNVGVTEIISALNA
jgi:spore coat polysaccharide biosynthesis protein SpsF (cytidylyltransferase family)